MRQSGPDQQDIREALSWRRRRARWLYTLADMFPWLIAHLPDRAVKSTIRETEGYFSNHDGIGGQVRELLKAPLRRLFAEGDRVMVIGHSMGSIIAYDAFWELWQEEQNPGRLDLFLTLGSPLGMHFVQERLVGAREAPARRYPGNISRWINAAARGDLTALDRALQDDFSAMLTLGLTESIHDIHADLYTYFRNEEGLNVHRSYGYLAHPRIGRVIADWWRAGD